MPRLRALFTTPGVAVLALMAAAALTYPLAAHLSSVVPNDLGDPLLNVWLLSWNARHLPFSTEWWNGAFFHPLSGTLTFSEHLAGIGLLTSPLIRLGASPLSAYNIALLLSFPMCALAAYRLCREITGRTDAAFVGAIAFGFAPYRITHISHIDVLSAYWMPLALLGLHRFRTTRANGWLVLFAVAWLLQVMCKAYAFFYLSTLIVLWLLWFVPWRDRQMVLKVSAAWGAAILATVPMLLKYRAVHDQYGLVRAESEIQAFSADVASLLDGSPLLAHWRSLWGGDQETWLYPGAVLTAIVLLGLGSALKNRRLETPVSRKRWRAALGALAAVAAGAALSAAVYGPWRLSLIHI